MSLYDYLTEQDKTNIDLYLNTYGPKSCEEGESIVPVETFLSEWSKEKEDLFHLFGDKFILEKPIQITSNAKLFEEVYDDLHYDKFGYNEIPFVQHYYRAVLNHYNAIYETDTKCDFTISYYLSCKLNDLISSNQLYTNRVPDEIVITTDIENDIKVVIHKGEKIMRALRKMVKLFNLSMDEFEEFRILVSRAIQKSECVQGTLCLSIHPLDYMTMSDNSHNWSSCMSWQTEGSYRGGTIEMLNSHSTIVAYIKDEKTISLNGCDQKEYVWPSKRWRELYYIDDNIITGIMGYPYQDEQVDSIVRNWLKELSHFEGDEVSILSSGYIKKEDSYSNFEQEMKQPNEFKIIGTTQYMYNDFERISHKVFFKKDNDTARKFRFNYGGRIFCIGCGKEISEYNDGSLFGDCCVPGLRCCCCGKLIDEDYACYDNNGDVYCENCFADNFSYDDLSEEYIPIDDSEEVNIVTDDLNVVEYIVTDRYNLRKCHTWRDTNGGLSMRACDMSEEFFELYAQRFLWKEIYDYRQLKFDLQYSCFKLEDEEYRNLREKVIATKKDLYYKFCNELEIKVDRKMYPVRTVTPEDEEDLLKTA